MVDPHARAGSPSRSEHSSSDELIDALSELAENAAPEEFSLPSALKTVGDEDDLDDAWQELRSLHRRIDRWRDRGAISSDRAERLRSKLLDLSRALTEQALDSQSRRYSELLRDVSHDIRSPLHSVIFVAEALYSGRSGSLGEGERRQIRTIYAASTSLLNLVNDLLDYARMDTGSAGEIEETLFSVDSVLSEVRQLLAPLVEHYGTEYEISVPEDARFRGDPQLLCRVLTNLASNAIEAAGEGGTVEVEVSARENGLGIDVVDDSDDADISRIECLLSRPEGETVAECVGQKRQGRSHGLGLLICGRLVDAAGGRADVERLEGDSVEGGPPGRRSTRIRVWLPFSSVGRSG